MHNAERLRKRRNINFTCEEEHAPLVEEPVPLVEEEPTLAKNVPNDMRKILCIDTGEVFNNAKEAGEKTGANPSSIIKCCNGNCKKAGKLKWRYYE